MKSIIKKKEVIVKIKIINQITLVFQILINQNAILLKVAHIRIKKFKILFKLKKLN